MQLKVYVTNGLCIDIGHIDCITYKNNGRIAKSFFPLSRVLPLIWLEETTPTSSSGYNLMTTSTATRQQHDEQ
jgi:hypothetical protein